MYHNVVSHSQSSKGRLVYISKYTKIEMALIDWLERYQLLLARLAIVVVYVWFGALKLFGLSPANAMVRSLQARTLPFLSFDQFIILFALFEMLIGILFMIPKAVRVAIMLFAAHMLTTTMPLLLLPEMTWQKLLVPTMEGQYIIKNVALIVLASYIGASSARNMGRSMPVHESALGDANVSTTRLYDRRKMRPEDSPTFHVKY
jgi:uncharacterized membrane protein YphA (DoxX/SURF4 family)